ncbi:MAG: hypothetical protein JXQ73_05520 [Phycisphaerae bacterium]|nr:hypothetical protein [Phycisphaerae bacterium]
MNAVLSLLAAALLPTTSVSPEHRDLEKGLTHANLARLDRGVQWKASDGIPPKYDASVALDGQACDPTGGHGYWAGSGSRMPVTLTLTFPRPTKIDTNVIIGYTADIHGVDYKLEAQTPGGEWAPLYTVQGNRYRDRVHRFDAKTVSKIRFTLTKPGGQSRVVMREFMLFEALTPQEEKTLMDNAARCLGPNEASSIVDLGIAVKAVTYGNSQGIVAPSPEGGHPIFYMSYYNTGGAELLAYDHRIKKPYRWKIPGQAGGYGLTLGHDGKVYVGTVGDGHLVQFDPKTQRIRDLGNAGQPTQYVWACATSPDGKIFGAGYPKCIPLIYDPKTDKLTSPGSISPRPDTDYLRYVAADAKGRAWFGVATKAALVVYDPADGSRRDVLPKQYAGNSMVYHLVRAGNRILASLLYHGGVLVFDADTCELVREIPRPPGDAALLVSVVDGKGNVYGSTTPSQHLYVIRPDAEKAVKVHDHFGMPKALLEDRYLLGFFDNNARILDLQTAKVIDDRKWIEPFEGMAIYTLTQGPGGMIYGSTYINQHFFRYDPDADKLQDLGRIIRGGGQCDSIAMSRDAKRVWLGCYSHAYLAVYDPARPYKLGTGPDCNPRDFGRLGGGQYRTRATVEGPDGRIYVGSIPSYNSAPTGALTIFDEKTLAMTQMTDLVPGGAVHCLAADDKAVFGSGGGKLFILDPKTAKKTKERDLGCTAMLIGPDGKLIVSAAGKVQGLNPETLATEWDVPLDQVKNLAGFCRMVLGPKGELYGMSDRLGIFQVDVPNRKLTQLTKMGSGHLAADKAGRLYFSQGANLCMCDPTAR